MSWWWLVPAFGVGWLWCGVLIVLALDDEEFIRLIRFRERHGFVPKMRRLEDERPAWLRRDGGRL